jgi:hypothetical protein
MEAPILCSEESTILKIRRQQDHSKSTDGSTGIILTLAGLVLLFAGVAFPFTRDAQTHGFPWQIVVGSVAAAFGGAVLSWMASVAVSRRAATADLGVQIAAVTRSVAQASGQILKSIERANRAEIEPGTAFELIYAQSRSIQSDVNEISLIIGTDYTGANVQETVRNIDEVSAFLGQTKAPARITARLNQVRSRVVSRSQQIPAAAPDAPPPAFKTVACPSCGSGIPIRIRPGISKVPAVCLKCLTSVFLNVPSFEVVRRGKLRVIEYPEIVKRNGSRPVIKCPDCEKRISAQIKTGENFYALCHDDDCVAVVPLEAFERWQPSG